MGAIRIQLQGSFDHLPVEENEQSVMRTATFGAKTFGHARAVSATIEWLSRYILPKAIALDSKLICQGVMPEHGIGIKDCFPGKPELRKEKPGNGSSGLIKEP